MLTLLATLLLHWLLAYHKPVTSLVAPYQLHPLPGNPYCLTAKQEKAVRQLSTAASPSDRRELTAFPNWEQITVGLLFEMQAVATLQK